MDEEITSYDDADRPSNTNRVSFLNRGGAFQAPKYRKASAMSSVKK